MDKLRQSLKLHQIKELRSRLSELEVAKAQGTLNSSEDALQRARANEYAVRTNGAEKRQERLKNLMQASENVKLDSARVVNIYRQTELELARSKELVSLKTQQVAEAQQNLRTQQQKLARYLQVEQRTRKLCERLQAQTLAEELRKD